MHQKTPTLWDGTFKIAFNSKVRSHSVSVFIMAPIDRKGSGLESLYKSHLNVSFIVSQIICQ
mgnify:CR=1 FL=1